MKQNRQADLFNSGPIRKCHSGAADLLDIWLDDDRPGQDFQGQVIVNYRDFAEESARGRDRHSRLTTGAFLGAERGKLSRYLPVFRFEGIHGVVVHGVEFVLAVPVKEVDWQELEQDVDEARVVHHVHW